MVQQRWIETPPTPEAVAARAKLKPDPSDPGPFDYLLQSKHGAVDVVPEVSGTCDELITRAARLDIGGVSFSVESVEDLLATLTVPRRAKDRERVERLRAIQRGFAQLGLLRRSRARDCDPRAPSSRA